MRVLSQSRSALRNIFRKRQAETQLDDELRAYVDLVTDEKIAAGMPTTEARRKALIEIGGVEQVKQAVRDRRAGFRIELLWQDLRYGVRQLRRNPGFTATVLITLAFSIGANTAIFSIVNALMLRSLPYHHPERLGVIFTQIRGPVTSDERHHVNGEQWELLRDDVPALLSAVTGSRPSGVNLHAGSYVGYVRQGRVSRNYLDVLSIQPLLGRNFSDLEDRPHGPKTAILSYGLWRGDFGADRDIVGKPILLKGEPYTVIGVLPEGAATPMDAEVYTALQPTQDGEGGGTNYELIVRLRDGATWQQADAQVNRAWLSRKGRYELGENPGAHVSYYTVPLQQGQAAPLRPQVMALMLAAGFILLIACANLAGLTLVRMLRRTPEVATRLALGASHWQVQRQMWLENLLLAVLGGAAGVAVGFIALRGLLRLLPEYFLPVSGVGLDGRVLAFTLIVSLLTSVLFGMLPAFATRRLDLRSAIGTRTSTGTEHLGLRQALIAGEVALTIVLLAASGLLIRTLIHLQTLPAGFNPSGVMTARVSLDDARYRDAAAFRKLLQESIAAMRRIPGVQNAAVGLSLPYERALNEGGITISDGKETGQGVVVDAVYVSPAYFSTLQIPLLDGRAFTDADGPNTQHVAIVNRTFARKFFRGANPIGRHLDKGMVIVGVVEDVQLVSGLNPVAPLQSEETLYLPATQIEGSMLSMVHVWFQPSWIVRTAHPVGGLTAQMQRALAGVDPDLPFSGFYSMSDVLAKSVATQRIEVALLGAMAALALLLSAVGIFALVANVVAQKTREIGIRIALGSSVRQAMVQIGAPGVRAVATGLILGLVLCAIALRAMRSVLYGIAVYDPATIVGVTLLLIFVAVIATIIPTLRIAGIDPAQTLREE
ncbi:MAG: ABC transporter permease [Silvibacterium sp.]|nr:ABC transporter permease [Silvibacterium sp.]